MTKQAIITVGVSGSGKSTFAFDLTRNHCSGRWLEVNRDHLRFNWKTPDWRHYAFTKKKEDEITRRQEEIVNCAAKPGLDYNIIISDTNLNAKTRNKWITMLESLGYDVTIKDFPITWEEAIRRNAQREGGITPTVLHKQWKQWLEYLRLKGDIRSYTPNWSDPLAFICDIDGTVAQMEGRSAYQWDKVGEDKVRSQVRDVVVGLVDAGYTPIYLSGRDGQCWYSTLQWLEDNGFPHKEENFFMRPKGNKEKDTIIKERMFWDAVAGNFNVQIAIDDRPCVVSMWNDIGIPCVMAVADQRNWF